MTLKVGRSFGTSERFRYMGYQKSARLSIHHMLNLPSPESRSTTIKITEPLPVPISLAALPGSRVEYGHQPIRDPHAKVSSNLSNNHSHNIIKNPTNIVPPKSSRHLRVRGSAEKETALIAQALTPVMLHLRRMFSLTAIVSG